MVSVQAENCAPIVRAFQQGTEKAQPWENASTLADGLRVPRAIGDFLILRAVRESGGTALAVSDRAMVDGMLDDRKASRASAPRRKAAPRWSPSRTLVADGAIKPRRVGCALQYRRRAEVSGRSVGSIAADPRTLAKLSHTLAVRTVEVHAMFGVLGWILFGLIVGALAKLVMPGRDPGGIIITMLLGIAGALVGGYARPRLGLVRAKRRRGLPRCRSSAPMLLLFVVPDDRRAADRIAGRLE